VDTLVPLFAVHLVWKRSNPWDEVFGRVPMNGIMATVPTSPSPSSTQGRVLHPTQNRMCSLREFELAQGFKDTFKLTRNVTTKLARWGTLSHRQWGTPLDWKY
jgi:hypothetical protein